MKKLMIAATIVCAAAMSQAATFAWSSGDVRAFGAPAASVIDNGPYNASTTAADRFDRIGPVTYTLALYDKVSGDLIGETPVSGTVAYLTGGKISTNIKYDAAADNTLYHYVLTLTCDQSNIRSKTSEQYDYSAAKITTRFENDITTAPMGNTEFPIGVPSSWTVSGITSSAPVPEPTSGLLLLLGVAGLALRRRRA